jgi:peptide/nickel transport system substrate-binding protein/oligopeptide transport system substrate-binding protein
MTQNHADVTGVPRDHLVVELDVLPHSLTLGRLFDFAGEIIGSALFDSLFVEGAEPCEMKAGMVKRASPRRDFKQWTLEIEKDLSWSDGTPLTAFDVGRAINQMTDPQTRAPLGWLANVFLGAAQKGSGRTARNTRLGCVVTSANKLELYLNRPLAYLPTLLGASCFSPCPESTESQPGAERQVSGPYRLAATLGDKQGIVLELNRKSRQARSSSPKHIVFVKTDSSAQTLLLYEQSRIDVTGNTFFPPHLIPRYRGNSDFVQAEMSMTAYLQPNASRFPCFNQLSMRKALSLAIDRYAISQQLNGAVEPLWRFTELWYPSDIAAPRQQPDKAVAELKRVYGKISTPIRLIYADFVPNDQIVNAIAEQVGDVLGIRVNPQPLCYEDYLQAVLKGDYDLLYVITPAAYQDPSSLLVLFRRDGILGRHLGFSDRSYDCLLGEAEACADFHLRIKKYREANDWLLNSLPVIPLFRVQSIFLRKPHLRGFSVRRSGIIPFSDIDLHGGRFASCSSVA